MAHNSLQISSVTHVIEGEEKSGDCAAAELAAMARDKKQSRIFNRYTYDAFGNTVSCEEEVHNRFRYNGEQYDPVIQQYYLRARYYNPVISRFTQEDTYYGDGLNLYRYCANNPVRYKDPSGHGSVEQNAYKRYLDVGADPDIAKLAAQMYPDLASKQHLVDKYKAQGYKSPDALQLANREIIFGTEATKSYGEQNMTKAFPDSTQPYDVNSDFRAQQRLYEGGSDVWDMTEGGGIINGREYSQHAMERMAPDTPSVRAELSRRAEALAESKGLQVGTPEYYQFCQKYVDPRNIPPSVIEDAIRNTTAVQGHTAGTFVHQTADVTVIVNEAGKVITVIPK